MADTQITLDIDSVKVHHKGAYVKLEDVDTGEGSVCINGAEVEHLGDGGVRITLPCEDVIEIVDVSKVCSTLLKACDLDPVDD